MYVVVAFETYSVAQVQSVLLTSFLKKYLFIWLHQVFVVACGLFIVTSKVFICGMWDLVP